jgi:Alpha-2,8-polysialyltransferase (POLYST)
MNTIVLASTLYGLATAVTALDNEHPASRERRLLVVANNAPMAEIIPSLDQLDGFDTIADRFDAVVSLNAVTAPYHPSQWRPAREDLIVLERLVRESWGIGPQPVRLLLESIQVRPAQTVAALFPDAPITVYADGLMSYGPTRNALSPEIFTRIDRLVLPDLVPGLTPLLLGEHGVEPEPFPIELLGKTLDEIGERVPLAVEPAVTERDLNGADDRVAVIIGQYLGPLGLLSAEAERDLNLRMLDVARRLGATRVLFKPHPSAAPSEPLLGEAARDRIGFHVVTTRAPLETLLARLRPGLLISAFSTALVMAQRLHGVRCVNVGARELLAQLVPYENSNRIPLVIVDATTPDGEVIDVDDLADWRPPDVSTLSERVRAVGYLMQPRLRPDLRPDAEAVLARGGAAELHVSRRRLTRLGLPGTYPGGPALSRAADTSTAKLVRRAARTLKREGLANTLRTLRH